MIEPRRRTHRARLLGLLLVSLWLTACGSGALPIPLDLPTPTPFIVEPTATPPPTPVAQPITLRYMMWDPAQVSAYRACADQFTAANPLITIEIEQTDWADYWDRLTQEVQAGAGPDVFVNHLTRLPDLAANELILDLEPLVQRDGLDDTIYIGRLPRMWMRAGMRFGLPKDWDTIALVYNQDLLADAGVSADELAALDWNPQDGGTFQEILARLTVDADGNNALSPEFDRDAIAHYALTMPGTDGGGAYGQSQWSNLAVANGFRFTDYLFADRYYYDDPALAITLGWYQRLVNELGYHTPFPADAPVDGRQRFLSGEAALITDGSWTISTYVNDAPFDVGFAPLPSGPQGHKSMLNSLADSIWAGTPHPEAAWAWVKYLGSVECQLTVGDYAVAFPALQSGVERMLAHYDAMGIDIRAYTSYLSATDENLFLFPVTAHAATVTDLMEPVILAILRGEADPSVTLPAANEKVNALFSGGQAP